MNKSTTVLAILAAVILTDVHWGIMQAITWTQMVYESTEKVTLVEKIASTVSGKAPCAHCVSLQIEKQSDQEQTLDFLAKSQPLVPIGRLSISPRRADRALFSVHADSSPAFESPTVGIFHPPRA